MTKLTLEQQELLFANDCKLINLRYEYHGYTGTEKWAIVTELAEEELWVKYPDVIRRYTPFILLSMAQGEVITEYQNYEANNDYIQLPPLKKDTPSDVIAFMWEYMKVPEDSREKVKNLLKDANENGVKLSHQAPTLYDVVPKEEITEFEELMRKTIADIVSEASGIACWVYVQKYVKQKTLDEMLQELPGAGQFIIVMDTWFERLMAE